MDLSAELQAQTVQLNCLKNSMNELVARGVFLSAGLWTIMDG